MNDYQQIITLVIFQWATKTDKHLHNESNAKQIRLACVEIQNFEQERQLS